MSKSLPHESSVDGTIPRDTEKRRPLVSVILAVFNEAHHIARCMTSLLEQETPGFDLEVLAVDGGSNDGTKEYLGTIASADSRVRVLVNKQRRAPFAFNLGLREAKGEYVCICGAHAAYAKDYISVCLTELLTRDVVGCGGRVLTQPSVNTLQARLVALTLAHPFGSSRKSVRTRAEGFADAAFMVIRKDPLIKIGGYSEELHRNQDNDTYQKLGARGYRFFCTWKTQCIYYPKATIRDILVYAFRTGFWNVISLERNPSSMAARHFIPFLFVMSVLVSALLGFGGVAFHFRHRQLAVAPLVGLITMHLTAGLIATAQVAVEEKFMGAVALPLVFFALHFSYGLGTLWAFLSRAKSRRSASKTPPSGVAFRKTATGD